MCTTHSSQSQSHWQWLKKTASKQKPLALKPEAIPHQYIVVFKPHLTSAQRAIHRAWAAERNFSLLSEHGHGLGNTGLLHKFNLGGDGSFAGYVARIPEVLAKEIERVEEVRIYCS